MHKVQAANRSQAPICQIFWFFVWKSNGGERADIVPSARMNQVKVLLFFLSPLYQILHILANSAYSPPLYTVAAVK